MRDFFTGAGELFPDEFVGFSALGVNRLRWGKTGELTFSFSPVPPLDEVVSVTLVPEIAASCLIQGNEEPFAGGFADLLDDANALF